MAHMAIMNAIGIGGVDPAKEPIGYQVTVEARAGREADPIDHLPAPPSTSRLPASAGWTPSP